MSEQQDLFDHLLPRPGLRDLLRLQKVQEGLPDWLYLGTTSWTNPDWEGLVYPPGSAAQDYVEHYARAFRAVEVDSTWYRIPSPRAVDGWVQRTPPGFTFAAKVPRAITHEKGLVGCQAEVEQFLQVMGRLGDRLGPLLLQFEYIARGRDPAEHEQGADFRQRLEQFLPLLPTDQFRFAVEVRNAKWVRQDLAELLRRHRVALALTSYYTMPGIEEVRARLDPVTADFLYLRFLGDRQRMEEQVEALVQAGKKKRRWDGLVWDRRAEIGRWVDELKEVVARQPGLPVYAFFNNHYAGYAPGSLAQFAQAWKK